MAGKSLNLELEDGDHITMTLSNAAKISLTDITAATIGNLSEETQWGDNSTTAEDAGLPLLRPWGDNSSSSNDQNVPVLRPWENNSGIEKAEIFPQNVVYTDKQPPTYKEHLKRRLDNDDITEMDDVTKRIKLEPTNLARDAAFMFTVPTITSQSSTSYISQSDTPYISESNSKMANIETLGQYTPQTFIPFSTLQTNQQNVTTQNSTLNTSTQNSMQSVPHKNSVLQYLTINQVFPSVRTEQLPSNKDYLPWTNTESKNIQNTEQEGISRHYRQLSPVESNKLFIDESGSRSHSRLNPFKSELIQSGPTQTYEMQNLHPAQDSWQTSILPSQMKYEMPPSRQEMIKTQQPVLSPLQPTPKYLQISEILQNKTSTEEYKPIQSPWQQMLNFNQLDQSQLKLTGDKQGPATPSGKGLMVFSNTDSPGIDSRFTESLSNLLGSPPPDSPLSKNPFLGDLQALLNRECKREIVPQSLFGMQGTNKQNADKKTLNVFERERNLQERFTNLQSSQAEDVSQLSSMFRYQSALIETERFRTLHECQYPGSYKESVNHHYDNQLHKVMDRVERSVELLENSNKENKANKVVKLRPHLSKEAVRLMEQWYQQNLKHPYPTNSTIEMLAQAGNINVEQVKKWFANKRNRSSNTRSLTEIAMQKRKLGQMPGQF